MSSALSLEDLIKNNKKSGGGGGGGGGSTGGRGGGRGSSGTGPNRRFNNRGANRITPYSLGKELFSEVGDLKRYSIHFDRSGRSKGTAEVVFSRRSDAAAAVKRCNNDHLDGKPMKIEIVGTNIDTPAVIPIATNGILANPNGVPRG